MATKKVSLTGASSACSLSWDSLPWSQINKQVYRLQMRIAKAVREGRKGKVKSLQRLLTRSFYGKCLAVKRVVQNKGAKTPGIDNILWKTPLQKMNAILALKCKEYKPLPLKRVLIPKKNSSKKRPLSIPAMKDRAMQALWLLALEPIAEERADKNSYGFRPKRSVADAIGQCYLLLCRKTSAQWVFEADIRACFDQISSDWLLENIPMDKRILKKFLKAGYMERGVIYPTTDGTPQGGIISPTLALIALSGLEEKLNRLFKKGTKVQAVIYCDDFIVTGASKEQLEKLVIPCIQRFLEERGLELSQEKSKITHIEEGFDFLGHNLRKFKDTLIIRPSKASVKAFLKDIRTCIKTNVSAKTENLIHLLNPKIRGWANYFRHICSSSTFRYVDHQIFMAFKKWCAHRHPNKGWRWIYREYYRDTPRRRWVFGVKVKGKDSSSSHLDLVLASRTLIRRHFKIIGEAHPYDPRFKEYFLRREQGQKSVQPKGSRPLY
ncbi:MAG: group II intron reverse transcriptase/maturase [Candidatus Paracaedibacteraceae bacterium]|nr:group II intron reverse transcriptase/maturase [Candidatus Paracaedibacteraceae bacterium]